MAEKKKKQNKQKEVKAEAKSKKAPKAKKPVAKITKSAVRKPATKKQEKKVTVKRSTSKVLSPEVAKAQELQKSAVKAASMATRINKISKEALKNALSEEERNAVRKKYLQKRKDAKFKADKAFSEYDTYLEEQFKIDNVYIETNEKYVSTDKGFITWLQRNKAKKK